MSNRGKIKPKKKLNSIILCGSAITKAEIESVFTGAFQRAGLVIVGVFYSRSHSHCYQLAKNRGIAATREIGELLTFKDVDMIIDFTGDGEMIKRVCETKPPHVRLMDHVTARVLLHALLSEEQEIDCLTRQVEKLKQEADNYWGLFDNAVAALFRTRISDGAIIMCNSKLADILGYKSREEVIGSYNVANNYVNPLKRIELLHLLATEGMVNSFEFQQRRVNGTIFWADLSARYFPDNDYIEGMLTDITARKLAEEKNKYLAQQLIMVHEEERKSIARDLHDELGQALTALQFSMNALKNDIPNESVKQRLKCDQIITDISRLGQAVRNISYGLRPDVLDTLGLIPAMTWLIRNVQGRSDRLHISFSHIDGMKRLQPEMEIVLYRIFQEALANVIRHAEARHVDISLQVKECTVILKVSDDGLGFQTNDEPWLTDKGQRGIGLLGMRERVDGLGGTLKISSEPGSGTLIHVWLPLNKDAHE